MYHISSYGTTDVGLERTNNEDAFGIVTESGIYVVCDGMGGHASGELASGISVETVLDFVTNSIHKPNFRWPFNSPNATSLETRILDCAVRLANREVFATSQADARHKGMGTTIVAILAGEDHMGLAHVGDSRIYRLRDNKLEQVTEDHSLLNHYRRTRPMTKDEIKNFKGKNVIVRAVGLRDSVLPEVTAVEYQIGDRYLLCTDGLTDLVDDEIIEAEMIAAGDDHQVAVNRLIDRALAAGGKDNVTVVVLQIDSKDIKTDEEEEEDEDTSPGFAIDADGNNGYWDQETMPSFDTEALPAIPPAPPKTPPTQVPPTKKSDQDFLNIDTPADGMTLAHLGEPASTRSETKRGEEIPPPPVQRPDLPTPNRDKLIPPPPPGRAQLPDADNQPPVKLAPNLTAGEVSMSENQDAGPGVEKAHVQVYAKTARYSTVDDKLGDDDRTPVNTPAVPDLTETPSLSRQAPKHDDD